MRDTFRMFERSGIYYAQHNETGKQKSLRTKNKAEAIQKMNVLNSPARLAQFQYSLGIELIRKADPDAETRTWKVVFDECCSRGRESTRERWERIRKAASFNELLNLNLVETKPEDFHRVLSSGGSSINHYLRRLHNHALQMGWLHRPILPPKLWPKIEKKSRRSIRAEEHETIIGAEKNNERRLYYKFLWVTGAAQTDAAHLTADNIDWKSKLLAFKRMKTGSDVRLKIGAKIMAILKHLPKSGFLFPKISKTTNKARAAEFRRRCRLLGIKGVSLHSYRYAWAERAATSGYSR